MSSLFLENEKFLAHCSSMSALLTGSRVVSLLWSWPWSNFLQPQSPVVRKQYKKMTESCAICEKQNFKKKETQTFRRAHFKLRLKEIPKACSWSHATVGLFVYSFSFLLLVILFRRSFVKMNDEQKVQSSYTFVCHRAYFLQQYKSQWIFLMREGWTSG